MNEFTQAFTQAFETSFELIGNHLGLFVGIPAMFITGDIAVKLVKVMCGAGIRRRPVVVAERQHYIRGENKYVSPEIDVEKCPVSDDCTKCRFYNSDACLRGYLYG